MKSIFDNLSYDMSKMTTQVYSTSFSLGIKFLSKDLHKPIYNIYGFVRFADEIVDSFHEHDKELLLKEFIRDTHQSIERGISLNPILNAFQETVNKYKIPLELIDTFLKSMEMDLDKSKYTQEMYEEYILGSAEVVGLMCLKVFVRGDEVAYQKLKPSAMKLTLPDNCNTLTSFVYMTFFLTATPPFLQWRSSKASHCTLVFDNLSAKPISISGSNS